MSTMIKKIQAGFTLIELVIVIAIIGILAAVAVPKFINLGEDATFATGQGIAGALASAASTNYVIRSSNPAKGAPATSCGLTPSLLQDGIPNGYAVSGETVATAGGSVECTISAAGKGTVPSARFTLNGVL